MLDVVWYNVLNHYRRSKTLTSLFKNSKQMDASQESPNLPSEQADTREVSPERLLAHFLGITAVSLILADAVFLLLGKFTNTHFLLNVIYGLFLLGAAFFYAPGASGSHHIFLRPFSGCLSPYFLLFMAAKTHLALGRAHTSFPSSLQHCCCEVDQPLSTPHYLLAPAFC